MEEKPPFLFDHITIETSRNVIKDQNLDSDEATLAFPGAVLHTNADLIRGHGTYTDDNGGIVSSVAGVTHRVNKLLRVRTLKSRYNGEVGDVVVGRIVEVQSSRWIVDINSTQYAVLLLSSVNLPGGELRRKSSEDQLLMTDYLTVGDLVSAEVQRTYSQGFVGLHTRSMKYGKLGQGVLVHVPYYLIKRRKSHFFNLPMGASLVLGCNGTVWISTVRSMEETEQEGGGYIHHTESCGPETRQVIARLANCVKILAKAIIPLSDTTILLAYEASTPHEVSSLIDPKTAMQISEEVIQECKQKEIEI
uniref:Ribosomal RNA-processing protein 4 n=1 Tax=Bursaphelenchus xylophilus TaxID=6326 RepID=A0A1I7RR74_BURXY